MWGGAERQCRHWLPPPAWTRCSSAAARTRAPRAAPSPGPGGGEAGGSEIGRGTRHWPRTRPVEAMCIAPLTKYISPPKSAVFMLVGHSWCAPFFFWKVVSTTWYTVMLATVPAPAPASPPFDLVGTRLWARHSSAMARRREGAAIISETKQTIDHMLDLIAPRPLAMPLTTAAAISQHCAPRLGTLPEVSSDPQQSL